MICLNYSELYEEAQERLTSQSKNDIERKHSIGNLCIKNQLDFNILLDEGAQRNLYKYKFSFKV